MRRAITITFVVFSMSGWGMGQSSTTRDDLLRKREELLRQLEALDRALDHATPLGNTPASDGPRDSSDIDVGESRAENLAPLLVGVTAAMAVVLLSAAMYFFVIGPRRRRRPFLEAVRLINQDDGAEFPRAESLLNDAITAGLSRGDVAEARFALAYVRARMERFTEGASVLGDLERTAHLDAEGAYLSMWIHSRLGDYEDRIVPCPEELYPTRLDNRFSTLVAACAIQHQV